jgi:[acyl-carrier-protein] S-malonyltransferase
MLTNSDSHKEYKDSEEVEYINPDEEGNMLNNVKAVYKELETIWLQLLGIDNINPGDDFNSLGGESLLAIQMMRLVRQRIGFQLEIADTFGYPTLGSLADFIADNLQETKVTEVIGSDKHSVVLITEASKQEKVDTKCCYEGQAGEVHGEVIDVPSEKSLRSVRDLKERQTMLMFPGQGSQKRGMCISMKNSPEAIAVFSQAEAILGYNVLKLFLDNETDIEEKLKSTEFVQVSLFLSCLAKIELKVERPGLLDEITCVAGLSVGEFVALVYAGVISFKDALKLVQERGKAMEMDVKRTATGMVSLLGPNCQNLEVYLKDHFPNMKISTYLADNQHTVAGTEEDCLSLVEVLSLKENQLGVIDVRKLRVAGGFHSAYMSSAEKEITPLIQKVEFFKPSLPIIMNVNAKEVEDPEEIKTFVCQQLISPVQWRNSILRAYERGVRNFVEVAPARVLSSIVQNRIEQCKKCTTEMIKV